MTDLLAMMPERAGEPSDKMDGPAAVGQFLREVSLIDLVVELVQNDLDAGATRTSIDFGEHGLLCEGDGEPLNGRAWARLESVIGAGGDIEAKKDGIGSKNHGLRSLFLLGDRIGIQSDGLRTDLTLRGDRRKPTKFKPAFWPRQPDAAAPRKGTRILAPYRTAPIKVPDGDNTTLQPLGPDKLDALFEASVAEAPERFISASQPGAPWRYTLTLSRHGKGLAVFTFECSPLKGRSRGIWSRTCKVRMSESAAKTILRRHAVRFACEITDGGKVPKLFRVAGRIWGELSWIVDATGRPVPARGRLRYPIAFTGQEARSGHGFDVSAAFIAGRSRHDISSDVRNTYLLRQAREAFASAGTLLAKTYGLRAAGLVRGLEARPMDGEEERRIVRGLLKDGGLCAATFDQAAVPNITGYATLPAGSGPLLPVSGDDRPAAVETLAGLASAKGPVIHPGTPLAVREHLEQIACEDGAAITAFGAEDAAMLVLTEENEAGATGSESVARRTVAALQGLEALRRQGKLTSETIDALKADGTLPTFDHRLVKWSSARRLDRDPPSIPGVTNPPVLHHAIGSLGIVGKGTLSVRRFNLDEYLSALDFNPVGQPGRQRFFGWLSKNAATLKAVTLRKLAEMPVWPGPDGVHRTLKSYCHPKLPRLQRLLATSLVAPSPAVITLIGSKRLPPKSPSLRTEPSDDELLEWHARTLEAVVAISDAGRRAKALEALETDMFWVLERHRTATTRMGAAHQTLSQTGELLPVIQLHVPSIAATACGLPSSQLTRPRGAALYQELGAHPRPTAGAILTALRDDSDKAKLFVRLEAYKRGWNDLAKLSAEPILLVDGKALAGEDCAFVGEPDYWGEWKVPITGDGVAEHHSLLSQIGVTRQRPTKDLSVAFFDWLSRQSRAVQQRHHAQVDRHWKEHSTGPLAWIAANQDIACIPVTSASKPFELVNLTAAMEPAERVYLDDFPEIREAALAQGKLKLTLLRAAGTRTTILDLVAAVGVRSLRAAVGSPKSVGGEGAVETVADLGHELSQLQSRRQLSDLRSRLPLNGVAIVDMKPEWQKTLKSLVDVRARPKLTARYRLHGREYEVPVRSGYDRDTGLILVQSDSDRLHEMYEVLADILFRAGRANAWGLLRASRDRRQLEFLATGIEETDGDEGDEDDDGETGGEGEHGGGGHVDKGHGLGAAKLEPVLPDPKPLRPITDPTIVPRKRRQAPKARTQSQAGQSLEEEEQKRALKQEHYGYHCQACLGEMEVLKAAPPGTYVFAPGYRQRLLHAHHVQHRQNGGALGAGNLIVVCEYHHRLWGDQLARDAVLAGLAAATSLKRSFPKDETGTDLEVQTGLRVEVPLSVPPYRARLFFTAEHAAAWRAGAADEAPDLARVPAS